jgi:hypothetical protein
MEVIKDRKLLKPLVEVSKNSHRCFKCNKFIIISKQGSCLKCFSRRIFPKFSYNVTNWFRRRVIKRISIIYLIINLVFNIWFNFILLLLLSFVGITYFYYIFE